MNPLVNTIIESYPPAIQANVLFLRQLIFDVAKDLDIDIQETLKWNEPSYLAKGGSTIRIAWRKATPTQYSMFFNCRTSLVETFKEIYADVFKFEGNREILFELDKSLPIKELKHCIQLSLNYHSIKHLPMLGV